MCHSSLFYQFYYRNIYHRRHISSHIESQEKPLDHNTNLSITTETIGSQQKPLDHNTNHWITTQTIGSQHKPLDHKRNHWIRTENH